MIKIHNLGFPRMGEQRELKRALESYWNKKISYEEFIKEVKNVRCQSLLTQKNLGLDWVPSHDFCLYDHVLETSLIFNHIPTRFKELHFDHEEDLLFAIARGCTSNGKNYDAGEMTKWFDTNYHYIVPELSENTSFSFTPSRLESDFLLSKELGINSKPVFIGPLTYLWLSKCKGGNGQKLNWLKDLETQYTLLLQYLKEKNVKWVQIDEPILSLNLPKEWVEAFKRFYQNLSSSRPSILLTSYFAPLKENKDWAFLLPVEGFHLDYVRGESEDIVSQFPQDKVLSLGVIDGRNIWKSNLNLILNTLKSLPIESIKELWLAPSCSLLHVPVSLEPENNILPQIKNWLAFAKEKLNELALLKTALNQGIEEVNNALKENQKSIEDRENSHLVKNQKVQDLLKASINGCFERVSPYPLREKIQNDFYSLPSYPTTTIGSFPQTKELRKVRSDYKKGKITSCDYQSYIKVEIQKCIDIQEKVGIDVFVHGEPERNDMVEYFGQKLEGFVFTDFGWVQSYGSRCVKPPIIFGDVSRPLPMTINWANYSQSLTKKPVKGMLTGPITMLQWSFVRDDQPREITARQIAFSIRDEVLDLEKNGIKMIQVDEPALREGLPLRKEDWENYLKWAVESFKISTSGVKDETQIHTHMCYAEFNDIIEAISALDADVITIETSRSQMELLESFKVFSYPNQIGPGVYDIHSPQIPTKDSIVKLIQRAQHYIPSERIWINPDCGLKTRKWEEVIPALKNMVLATKELRDN